MVLVKDKASSGRELLHRVAMLLASDLPIGDLVEKFGAMLTAATGVDSISVALRHDGRPYLDYGPPPREGAVVIPIFGGSGAIGDLAVQWPAGTAPDDYESTILEAAAIRLGARVQHEFEREERDRLKQIASTDALTGLANRRTFDETLAREWARCARSQSPLSVLLLDVDFFKVYNDTYGHVAGDACLQRVARAIASSVKRPGDVACRYGGEEFAVILPETSVDDAVRVAEAICACVRGENIAHQGSSLGYATVSIGCAGTMPRAGVDAPTLTEAADEQLYRAKEHGRNRVASATAISDAPVVERQSGPKTNLPAPRNLFFGRDGDLDVMSALLRGCRVLTVAGPGGIGKTRLAVEFARRHAAEYRDGVYFVDFAALGDGALVAPTILTTMGLAEAPGNDASETLCEHLRGKHVLLVLDNCEHLADRVALLLERLVAATAESAFVVTTRRSLRIDGEQVYKLATLQQGDAVALFSSRAQAVMPSFSLTAENIETVKGICRELNGIPLAIEIAAARVRTIKVGELEHELTERAHRRTVDDTIEWSYGILGKDEKLLMRRLSVFAAAFSLDAAQAICVTPADSFDLLDVLGTLIDKSLVQSNPLEGRYWLLESTREFGRRMIEQNGEFDLLRARYVDVLAEIARGAERQFANGAGDDGRAQVDEHYADFRSAMEWALAAGGDVTNGARLVTSLGWYWTERGLWREARYWLDMALRHRPEALGMEHAARLLLASAVAYYVQGDFPAMDAEAKRCETAYRTFGDETGIASAQNLMAIAAQFSGNLERAYELWQSVLVASKNVANVRMEAVVLGNLAELVADWKGDYAQSERLYEEASRLHRQMTNSFPLAVTLGDWSATAAYQGDLRRAERLASEALEIFRGFDEEMRVLEQLIRIAHYRIWAARYDEAKRTLREVVELLPNSPNPLYLVRAAEALCELAFATGRETEAARLLRFADDQRTQRSLVRPAPVATRLDAMRNRLSSERVETPSEPEALELARAALR